MSNKECQNQVVTDVNHTTRSNIHPAMTIDELFMKHPQKAQKLAQELTKSGLNCVGCSASTWETLESGCLRHGMDDAQMNGLINKLNTIIAETSDETTISLTKKAAEKFVEIAKEDGKLGWSVRFDEKPAGCNGFEYVLDFSEHPKEQDCVFSSHGVDIHVDQRVLGRLIGCEIDFIDGLNGGFKISNPNARSSCGCGTSHGY